jgi:glycerol kinase
LDQDGPIIIGVDQGTTNTKAIAVNAAGEMLAQASRPIDSTAPRPGWVDQDAVAMFNNVVTCVRDVLAQLRRPLSDVIGLGIANQTETLIIWDGFSGAPVLPAMVWQCRRGEAEIAQLRHAHVAALLRQRTGLDLDPTFTAAKLAWVVKNHPDIGAGLRSGALLAGTVDCWLIWRLTGGKIYATEPGNASRTMLVSLESCMWDQELFDIFDLRLARQPDIGRSARSFGQTDPAIFGAAVPITAAMGDQQASLFGHGCFAEGDLKVTYGTGAFMWANAGQDLPLARPDGLIRTVAWDIGEPVYAIEGFVMSAGATLNWLARQLGLRGGEAVVEQARGAGEGHAVQLVPAFQGLASPWWNADVRATLSGMTEATTVADICQAGLEAVCYQIRAVLDVMSEATGHRPAVVRADGGLSRSGELMQLQADCLMMPMQLASYESMTAYGVALMAGIGAGLWRGTEELRLLTGAGRAIDPRVAQGPRRETGYRAWLHAVDTAIVASANARQGRE